MNKPYGAQGEIQGFPFKDLHETFYNQGGIEIEVTEGILRVGVSDPDNLEEAKERTQLYLSAWAARHNIRLSVIFNHVWRPNQQGGQDHALTFEEQVKVRDRVQVQVTTHQIQVPLSYAVVTEEMRDTASFTNDETMVQKAGRHPALKSALLYYSQEVVDDERPLYGVYKAIEAMIGSLSGRDKRNDLANMAGQPRSYVDDVMQTTQVRRHHSTTGTRRLSDEECRERAKILIDAYANSLP